MRWTLFHIVLALVCTVSPYPFIIWFYLVLLTGIAQAFNQLKRGNFHPYIALLFYLVSFEMLGRMTRAYPYIPSEVGKYFLILFFIIGIIIRGIRSSSGLIMSILITPAIFYDLSGQRVFTDIVFNAFGPLALALGVTLLYKAKISQYHINRILHLIWLTCLSALFFTFIKTPDLESIDFNLKASFATTADTSSNQVATILGLGMFLTFYSIINRLKFSGNYLADMAMLMLFSFQGLLSFSRGGMLIAALGMLVLLLNNKGVKSKYNRKKLVISAGLAAIGIYVISLAANQITDGKLFLRYSGETEGTLLGNREKTADVFVSGRLTILSEDIMIWKNNTLMGVGAGASRYLREKTNGVVPHLEFSRLLAEHGVLGLLYFVMMLVTFFNVYRNFPKNTNKGLFLALFTIGIFTTFHAAMRTYVTPVLFILAVLYIKNENNRKLIGNNQYTNPDNRHFQNHSLLSSEINKAHR